jgi:hypothetical protein
MALSRKKITFENLSGIDQRWKAPQMNAADDVTAARVDPLGGGWLFDRGIEPWWDPGTSFTPGLDTALITALFVEKVDSLYVWSKQNTEQIYYIVESGGKLYYWIGNKGTLVVANFYDDWVLLQEGRHKPKLNEPGTQYIPYGNRLLIINGYDKPLWFYGGEKIRDFGFTLPTPSPEPLDIQPKYLDGTDDLNLGVAAPHFESNSSIGLGYSSNEEFNNFDWKMTFISDTGSESPLSAATGISWQTDSNATQKKFGVVIKHLPTAPSTGGIVARRLYRTKNQKVDTSAGANDSTYYLVNQINDNTTEFYVDIIPDGQLIDTAPSISDTSTIQSGYSFGATWNGSIWLAGGSQNPTKIIYSKQGLPEQFGAFDYFDVGNTAGGAITGLVAFYNNLIVFRQRSIDIIRVGNGGSYQVSQLTPEIGTTAVNTAKIVPGVGLMFLGYDGIYAIGGGLDGGSSITVSKTSSGLAKEIPLISRNALPRATAVYSAKEREYWIHYIPNGFTYNCRGIVYHIDNGQWSLRHTLISGDEYLWAFTALASDPVGNIIIGTLPNWTSDPFDINFDALGTLVGLQVWSGNKGWGKQLELSGVTNASYEYTTTDVAKPTCKWESDWIDFDDNSVKHRVFYLELDILAYGDNLLQLTWQQDYSFIQYSAGGQKMAKSEKVFTTGEDPVLGPDNGASKNYFTIGSSTIQEPRVIRLRWDVNTGLVDHFKFFVTGSDTFHVLGIDVHYSDTDQMPLNQRINLQMGQPQ